MLELIALLFSITVNVGLAVFVLVKNPTARLNRYFAFLAFTLVVWMTANYFSVHPVFFDQLTWIRFVMASAAIMSMAILLLVNVFPNGMLYDHRLPSVAGFLGVIVGLIALTPLVFSGITDGQPEPGFGMAIFAAYAVGTIIYSLFILFSRFRSLRGRPKEHVRYALVGIVLTFSLLAFFNFVLVVLARDTTFILLSPILSLIFTTSFAYGMMRHQLFDIRFIVARFVAYLLLLTFAGVVYGFTASLLSFFVAGINPNFTQILVSTLVVGTLILFVQPLMQFFNYLTRTVFYQDDYDTKDVLDQLASVLVRSADTKMLARNSLLILRDALKCDYISLLLVDGDKAGVQKQINTGKGAPDLVSMHVEKLLRRVTDVTVVDTVDRQNTAFHDAMQQANVAVVMRLETRSEIIGYCFFGFKTTGSAYAQRDIELMRIAGDELAVAIQNTLRYDQIQTFNDTLQQRIEEATRELRNSNQQLHRLDEAKDEFVSMASHQLRTPLTSVKGYISMVLEGDAGKVNDMQRKLLSEAFTSSERMVHLINDFLNVSRLQTGKFVIESKPIDLVKLINEEVESLRTTAEAHALTLHFKQPKYFPVLYIDEGKIRQVLMNFIDNAVYYSRPDTAIDIKLAVEDGQAVVTVSDTGIGVPKTEQSRLFTKFYRASNARKQRPDGTGVGLFLAKRVIVAHGGTMVFHSTEGEGSTFGFRLPVKKLSEPASNSADELEDKPAKN